MAVVAIEGDRFSFGPTGVFMATPGRRKRREMERVREKERESVRESGREGGRERVREREREGRKEGGREREREGRTQLRIKDAISVGRPQLHGIQFIGRLTD